MHSGSFYFCLQSFELFTQMKMKTKWNEDYSNIACLWGLRQFRKNSQCCSVVINSLEVATAFWCQSLCCCGQMWQDRTARCFPPANTLSSLMKRSWAAWRQLLMLRMWGSVTSSAATSKCHPKWCACSQGNLELKPADFLVLHALYCSPTFTPSPSPRTLFPHYFKCGFLLGEDYVTTLCQNPLCNFWNHCWYEYPLQRGGKASVRHKCKTQQHFWQGGSEKWHFPFRGEPTHLLRTGRREDPGQEALLISLCVAPICLQ